MSKKAHSFIKEYENEFTTRSHDAAQCRQHEFKRPISIPLQSFVRAENVDQADLKNDWQPLIIIMKQTATSSADVRLLSRHEKRFVKPSQVSQTFYFGSFYASSIALPMSWRIYLFSKEIQSVAA